MSSVPELSLVVPAYNEAPRIADVLRGWNQETRRLGIRCEILVYDDGSTDATPSVLKELAGELASVTVRRHTNRGHGPTLVAGYRAATGRWVLQVDGDDEIGPGPFEPLWQVRDRYDLIIGRRRGRRLSLSRRLLTLLSRCGVGLLFGWRLSDVNSPYRLIRRDKLVELLDDVPPDTFAPNVAIAGLALSRKFRVLERDVPCRPSLQRRNAHWNVLTAGTVTFTQLLATARRSRRLPSAPGYQRTTR
jgi:glycosyltransferase involved in cell wall biosynthesis